MNSSTFFQDINLCIRSSLNSQENKKYFKKQDEKKRIGYNKIKCKQLNLKHEQEFEQDHNTQIQNQACRNGDKNKKQVQMVKKYTQINKTKRKNNKKVQFIDILKRVCQDETIRLSFGIQIQKDGIIRFNYSISHFSFGFNYCQNTSVSYYKQDSIVEIDLSLSKNILRATANEAIAFIAQTPCKKFKQVQQILQRYQEIRESQLDDIFQVKMDNYFKQKYDDETSLYIESCKQYIQEYSNQNPTQIFQYGIGRINYEYEDVQIIKLGYSKAFLDLIGIDIPSFTNIILRHQKIDLIPDKEEIMEHSLKGLQFKLILFQELKYDCQIVTFDGFRLRVSLTKRQAFPSYQSKEINMLIRQMFLSISQIDVNLDDLQNLIIYREKLLRNDNSLLTFDEYIQKELSFNFEDVEYSVLSQSFLEKYYSENVIQLKEIQLKYKKKNNFQSSKQSNYKYIESQSISPIEIISSFR
ncbi:hypothetical protein ABPG72_018965 [Tetrahymena utriculariae]